MVTQSLLILYTSTCYTTSEVKEMKVVKKYDFSRNGYTKSMVIDKQGKHFNVNKSFWCWKWDSVKDWNRTGTNKLLYVKYYGWRWPLLGLFPNIVMLDLDKESMEIFGAVKKRVKRQSRMKTNESEENEEKSRE